MSPTTPDINEAARAYLAALVARDVVYLAAASWNEDAAYCGIGSLPDERWSLQGLIEHLKQYPPTRFANSNPSGFVQGDLAWLVDFPDGVLPDGTHVPIRATLVMSLDQDRWKVVHWHVSEGVAHTL